MLSNRTVPCYMLQLGGTNFDVTPIDQLYRTFYFLKELLELSFEQIDICKNVLKIELSGPDLLEQSIRTGINGIQGGGNNVGSNAITQVEMRVGEVYKQLKHLGISILQATLSCKENKKTLLQMGFDGRNREKVSADEKISLRKTLDQIKKQFLILNDTRKYAVGTLNAIVDTAYKRKWDFIEDAVSDCKVSILKCEREIAECADQFLKIKNWVVESVDILIQSLDKKKPLCVGELRDKIHFNTKILNCMGQIDIEEKKVGTSAKFPYFFGVTKVSAFHALATNQGTLEDQIKKIEVVKQNFSEMEHCFLNFITSFEEIESSDKETITGVIVRRNSMKCFEKRLKEGVEQVDVAAKNVNDISFCTVNSVQKVVQDCKQLSCQSMMDQSEKAGLGHLGDYIEDKTRDFKIETRKCVRFLSDLKEELKDTQTGIESYKHVFNLYVKEDGSPYSVRFLKCHMAGFSRNYLRMSQMNRDAKNSLESLQFGAKQIECNLDRIGEIKDRICFIRRMKQEKFFKKAGKAAPVKYNLKVRFAWNSQRCMRKTGL